MSEQSLTREFRITLTQDGSRIAASLWSPTLMSPGAVNGRIRAGVLTLDLRHHPGDPLDDPYYEVLERIGGVLVGIRGVLQGEASRDRLSIAGVLEGGFDFYGSRVALGAATACNGRWQATMRRDRGEP